jgi:hypothetical protein
MHQEKLMRKPGQESRDGLQKGLMSIWRWISTFQLPPCQILPMVLCRPSNMIARHIAVYVLYFFVDIWMLTVLFLLKSRHEMKLLLLFLLIFLLFKQGTQSRSPSYLKVSNNLQYILETSIPTTAF